MLLGWHFGVVSLLQVRPGFTPMAYNTAISFLLLGLALTATGYGRRGIAKAAALAAGAIAFGGLFHYLSGAPQSFESILSQFTMPRPPLAQVPMAPNTAVGLLLSAVAVWLSNTEREFAGKAAQIMFSASATAVLGLDALLGYLTALPMYVWGGFGPMALHTSVGLLVIGIAIVANSWRGVRTADRLWPLVVILIPGIVTSVSFWQALSVVEAAHLESGIRVRSGLPEAVLIFGLIVTALLATAIWLAQTARRRAATAEDSRCAADKALQALSASELKYRTLVESLPQKIAYKDRKSVYVSCNENYADDLAVAPAAVSGKTDYDFFPKELAEKYRTDDRRVMELGVIAEIEEEYLCRGQRRWVQTVKSPVRGENGAVVGVIVIFWDITDRKDAEQEVARATEALEAERRRFSDVVDMLPAYVVLLSPTYHVPFANRFFRERFGESHGKRCFEYLFGRSEPCEICQTYKVLQTGAPQRWEWTGPDGRNYDVYDFPFNDVDGSNLILEMGLDVTERKLTEDRIRQQAALLDLAHDAIIVRDLESRILFWNQGAVETYGWPATEAEGRVSHELLQTRFPTPLAEIETHVQQQGKWEGELTHVTRDGRTLIVASRWSLQKAESGAPRAILEINRDVTDRKRAEEALEQKAEDLARSNADLEQFAYVASHDLQEPLRMVANFTQLLAERYRDQLDTDGVEFIGFAVDGARRMQRLIQDLLMYSRVGTRGKKFERTDCNEVLGQVIANLQVAIQESGGLVTHDTLPTVMADASQLPQVFQNLISNAIKFRGKDAPRVHVTAARQGARWMFTVRDNGIGIDPEFADQIFVIFQRLHSREEYPGTGIGLALCKKIVERHGGRIWVESQPGNGATFYFTIPAA